MSAIRQAPGSDVRLRDLLRPAMTRDQRKALLLAEQVSFLPMEAIGEQGELDLSQIRNKEDVERGYTQFFDGDVLVAKITPCFENGKGAVAQGLVNGVGFGTTELHVLRPGPDIDARFLYYVTASPIFRRLGEASMVGAAGQKRVPEEYILDYRLSIPRLSEQRAIAAFLDRELLELDALIAEKERLLDLLAEKRRALNTQTVTRGLATGVALHDSGVEWLGAIPAHWDVIKIKHLAQVGNGSTPLRDNKEYWESGSFPWLTSTVVNDVIVGDPTDFVTEFALQECHLPIVQPNSVLVAITGEGKTRGKAALLNYPATINQHVAFISPRTEVLVPAFLQLVLACAYGVLRMISEGMGSTKGALTCEQLGDFFIPLPPPTEQAQILDAVGSLTDALSELAQVTGETMLLLHERRAALIAAAVTGQLQMAV